RDISIGARDIKTMGRSQWDCRRRHWNRMSRIRYIEDFQSFAVGYKGVAELNGNTSGLLDEIGSHFTHLRWFGWIIDVQHDKAAIAKNVKIPTSQSARDRPMKFVLRVVRRVSLEEVIGRISIHERTGAYNHQTFLRIRNKHIAVNRGDLLFFVFRPMVSREVNPERAGQDHGSCVFRSDISPLSKRRDRRCDDVL